MGPILLEALFMPTYTNTISEPRVYAHVGFDRYACIPAKKRHSGAPRLKICSSIFCVARQSSNHRGDNLLRMVELKHFVVTLNSGRAWARNQLGTSQVGAYPNCSSIDFTYLERRITRLRRIICQD